MVINTQSSIPPRKKLLLIIKRLYPTALMKLVSLALVLLIIQNMPPPPEPEAIFLGNPSLEVVNPKNIKDFMLLAKRYTEAQCRAALDGCQQRFGNVWPPPDKDPCNHYYYHNHGCLDDTFKSCFSLLKECGKHPGHQHDPPYDHPSCRKYEENGCNAIIPIPILTELLLFLSLLLISIIQILFLWKPKQMHSLLNFIGLKAKGAEE